MDRVEELGEGKTRSTYVRYGDVLEKECEHVDYVPALAVQYVNVSASHFMPQMWKKVRFRIFNFVLSVFDAHYAPLISASVG